MVRRSPLVVVALAHVLFALALPAMASAQDNFTHAFGGRFGDLCELECQVGENGGSGAGQTDGAAGVAVREGELFVADRNNHRIVVRSASSGRFLRAFGKNVNAGTVGPPDVCTTACRAGESGGGAGQLALPEAVSVTNGKLYVVDDNPRVTVFDASSGAFLLAFGKAVDPGATNPDVCTSTCQPGTRGGAAGQFQDPAGIVGGGTLGSSPDDSATRVYVVDAANNRISRYTSSGAFLQAAGKDVGGDDVNSCSGFCQAGTASTSYYGLNNPTAIAITEYGDLYVSDAGNHRINWFQADLLARGPFGKNVNPAGGDTCGASCQPGSAGSGAGELAQPRGLSVVPAGGVLELYLTDEANHRVSVFNLRTQSHVRSYGKDVNPAGGDVCTSSCGAGSQGGGEGRLAAPIGLATIEYDRFGVNDLFVLSTGNRRVEVLGQASGVFKRAIGRNVGIESFDCTYATGCSAGTAGPAPSQLDGAQGIATEINGNSVYVADTNNGRVGVYTTSSGAFERAFGKGVNAVAGASNPDVCTRACANGTGAGAGALDHPKGIALGGGRVFVADSGNHRVSVFDQVSGAFVRAFGKGVNASDGSDVCVDSCQAGTAGGGPAQLSDPSGVTVAGTEVLVADTGNHRIAVFDADTGAFLRAYGKGVNAGDPASGVCATSSCQAGTPGTSAGALTSPVGIAHGDDVVYVTESTNRVSAFAVASGAFVRAFGRDVNPVDGADDPNVCTSSCRAGEAGGGDGQLSDPTGLAVFGAWGDVMVADTGNDRVMVFTSHGRFERAVGKNVNSAVGAADRDVCLDGCQAGAEGDAAGQFRNPRGIATSGGRIAVADTGNHRISDLRHDFGQPPAPTGLSTVPGSPAPTTTPKVRGTAPAGTTVVVYTKASCQGAPAASGTAAEFASGLTVTVAVASTTTFRAMVRDAAGNGTCGSPTTTTTYTQDSVPPDAPTNLAPVPGARGQAYRPTIKGTAEPGTTVKVYATAGCTGTPLATGTAEAFATGLTINQDVPFQSTTTYRATATDGVPYVSGCSTSTATYTHDVTPPNPPSNLSTDPASPGRTATPKVKGTAEAGSTVRIYAGFSCTGTVLGSGSAADFASGGIEISAVANGATQLTVTATDQAGMISPCGFANITYTRDATPPAVPTSLSFIPSSSGKSRTPTIYGSQSESGSTVRVYDTADCTGTPVASVPGPNFGAGVPVAEVAAGSTTTYRATATDALGNASACSSSSATYTHVLPPAAPSALAMSPASPSADRTPEITGTADQGGSMVRVYDNGACSGSPVVSGTPSSFASPGLSVSVARASTTTYWATVETVGGTSACSSDSVTYTHAPGPPPSAPTDLTSSPLSPSSDASPEIKGTAAAGTTVKLYTSSTCSGVAVATGTAAAFASPGLTVAIPSGATRTFYATATNEEGDSSCSTSSAGYTHIAPAAPTGLTSTPESSSVDTNPRIQGTAPAGSTVYLYEDAGCLGTEVVNGTAANFASPGLAVSVPTGTTRTFYAQARDAQGSRSACSSGSVTYTATTPPPAPQPPVAVTQSAQSVTTTTATLHGAVGPDGVSYGFEYGTSTAYGRSTPTVDGTAAGGKQASISGLTPGTTYYVRVFADKAGFPRANGDPVAFRTADLPAPVRTEPAPSGTQTVTPAAPPPVVTPPPPTQATVPAPGRTGTTSTPPRTTAKPACSGLAAKARATCLAKASYAKAMKACARKRGAQRSACRKAAAAKRKKALARARKL